MALNRMISCLALLITVITPTKMLLGVISLKDSMTLEEQKKTGVYQLTDAQQKELENWMNKKMDPNLGNKQETIQHTLVTLVQNNKNGAELVFSNNVTYQIAPEDQAKTSGWLSPVVVKIQQSSNASYPWNLTNTGTKDVVKARINTSPNNPTNPVLPTNPTLPKKLP